MAIDQGRMMTLITAGMNFKDAYEQLVKRMHITNTKIHEAADAEAKQGEWNMFYYGYAPFMTEVSNAVTLITEFTHFRRNKRGNELRAGYQRRKRDKDLRGKPAAEKEYTTINSSVEITPEDNAELWAQFNAAQSHVTCDDRDGQTSPSNTPKPEESKE